MATNDNNRPIANTPVTDAAAATAPDDTQKYGSNADLRVAEDTKLRDAAITATGEDVDNDHADERPQNRSQDAPENSEQDDEHAQAHTIAGDAQALRQGQQNSGETGHGGRNNPAQLAANDEQDVVDHMEQMERSGMIDNDAYRGERSDDDEPAMFGEQGMEPGDLDEHGNPRRDEQFTPVE